MNINSTTANRFAVPVQTQDYNQPSQVRADWSEIETTVLVTSWRDNYLKSNTMSKDGMFTEITKSVNLVGKKHYNSVKTN